MRQTSGRATSERMRPGREQASRERAGRERVTARGGVTQSRPGARQRVHSSARAQRAQRPLSRQRAAAVSLRQRVQRVFLWGRRHSVALSRGAAVAIVCVAVLVSVLMVRWAMDTARETRRERAAQQAAAPQETSFPFPQTCAPDELSVSVDYPESVAVGAGLQATLTVKNAQSQEDQPQGCLLDVGATNIGMTITSGGAIIANTVSCSAAAGEDSPTMLLLPAEEGTTVRLSWDGQASGPECDLSAGDSSTMATAGTYRLQPTLGGNPLGDDRVFQVQ